MNDQIAALVTRATGNEETKLKFLNRLDEGRLTRSENPTSHICVYFAAYDPRTHHAFVGLHKKSGLWLFNGGHMDPNEAPIDTVIREAQEEWGITLTPNDIPNPTLATLTEIEHPEKQVCEWHYDLWYFLPFDEREFHPDDILLKTEFSEYGWKTPEEVKNLFVDPASLEALAYCKNLR